MYTTIETALSLANINIKITMYVCTLTSKLDAHKICN